MRFLWALLAFLSFLPAPVRAEDQTLQLPIAMAPHRALYAMDLKSAKAGSGVQGVKGTMFYDVQDTCDGWAIALQMNFVFDFTEGETSNVASSVVTWEAKDGSAFRFNIRRVADGQVEMNQKGYVETKNGKRIAHFTLPEGQADIELGAEDIFPTRHTLALLEKARKGEKMYNRRIFDGSEMDGSQDVSAFINTSQQPDPKQEWPKDIKAPALMNSVTWPLRLAYYKPTGQDSEPDFEMELALQENGIARSLMIDYGDFAVQGKLVGLEAAPALDCKGKAAP